MCNVCFAVKNHRSVKSKISLFVLREATTWNFKTVKGLPIAKNHVKDVDRTLKLLERVPQN